MRNSIAELGFWLGVFGIAACVSSLQARWVGRRFWRRMAHFTLANEKERDEVDIWHGRLILFLTRVGYTLLVVGTVTFVLGSVIR